MKALNVIFVKILPMRLETELDEIKRELSALKSRQEYLEDALLSAADIKALKEARTDFEKGRTISLPKLKKKLGL